ncbi:MAG: hypothetical protein GVY10_12135 [Verrucomicrobia bacterium]|jgi:guanylate kinase|nr:hypothetical protein [Verrucomicrobiota bacterium]
MTLHTLLIITGPSCVGKSPLLKALERAEPTWTSSLRPLVLYNSRDPRPGETEGRDYYFRSRRQIEAMEEDPEKVLLEVRGDLQALDLGELREELAQGPVLYEGNPFIGRILQKDEAMAEIPRRSVLISPLSREELAAVGKQRGGGEVEAFVTEVMRRKLLRRTAKQKTILSLPDLENIERRASSAWKEIGMAPEFDHVVVNHDGEDSENWDAFAVPLGEARRTLFATFHALQGKPHEALETWDALPDPCR